MTRSKADTQDTRVRALAQESAAAAAAAFGRLCGEPMRVADVLMWEGSISAGAGKLDTGIVFEVDGAVRGVVALLLSGVGRATVLEALDAELLADSALREAGNIVASHSVSAVADRLGTRVTLSVPTLVREDAGSLIDRLLARRVDVVVTATELWAAGETPDVVLVLAVESL
ncbi:MAG: chemotaxis protein CheC [Deltaproteobacteria bacterium]|nr:chemotaxis protein CheC [Deltaproteobacteria bacterium]MBW2359812.1 chemotaxis protein CheC [Deltaproteobacteria bacterium]